MSGGEYKRICLDFFEFLNINQINPSLNLSTSALPSLVPPVKTRFVGAAALPRAQNQAHNVLDALAVLDFGEYRRPAVSVFSPDLVSMDINHGTQN